MLFHHLSRSNKKESHSPDGSGKWLSERLRVTGALMRYSDFDGVFFPTPWTRAANFNDLFLLELRPNHAGLKKQLSARLSTIGTLASNFLHSLTPQTC